MILYKKVPIFVELAMSQRWSAIFCATGVWGDKPIGCVRVNTAFLGRRVGVRCRVCWAVGTKWFSGIREKGRRPVGIGPAQFPHLFTMEKFWKRWIYTISSKEKSPISGLFFCEILYRFLCKGLRFQVRAVYFVTILLRSKKRGDSRTSLVKLGVFLLWHVA